jgi:NADH-quinone oxidoreductase subunit F
MYGTSLDGDAILLRIERAGLRGRGGGWFPAAAKWRAVRAERAAAFVVGNGAEGEPGSIKDRWVMTRRPADVLSGLLLAARAVGAREATIYLKGSFAAAEAALSAARDGQAAGEIAITIHRGHDSYIAGEETALLESLEGRRPWPRPKPPLPAAVGFRGRPTLVQNVETLARVPAAVRDPEAFAAHEKTLVSLWGRVRRPGVYEVPLGTPLSRILEEQGGGVVGRLRLILPAGPSGPPLLASEAETPLDPQALRGRGSALGTASIFVADDSMCPLALAASIARFFERESCGQCPPCTVGSASLARVLGAVEEGSARARDIASALEVAGFMSYHGYCAHSRTAAAVASAFLRRVPEVVEAHLAARGCPESLPKSDPFGPDSPERGAIEEALAQS